MKQITIYDLLPLLKKGYVAMQQNGDWWWFSKQPVLKSEHWAYAPLDCEFNGLTAFDIAPVEDWKKSLRKVEDYQKDTNKLADSNSENRVYKKEEV